jgi:SAM-dependent methyltransferase
MDPSLHDRFYAVEKWHWWSVGMRGIFDMLLSRALPAAGARVLLDVGCGTGIVMEEFARHGAMVGLDLAWPALLHTRSRNPAFALMQGDIVSLPVRSGSVDVVLAFDVIEHLDDDAAALREFRRVLKPGGVLLLNVPAFMSLWSGKDIANHHRRRYRRTALRGLVERAGFTVERITCSNAVLFPAIWATRQAQRLAHRPWSPQAEYHPAGWLNAALTALLHAERRTLAWIDLPLGTSVTCLARSAGPPPA